MGLGSGDCSHAKIRQEPPLHDKNTWFIDVNAVIEPHCDPVMLPNAPIKLLYLFV